MKFDQLDEKFRPMVLAATANHEQFAGDMTSLWILTQRLQYRHLGAPPEFDALYKHLNTHGVDDPSGQLRLMMENNLRFTHLIINGLDGEAAEKIGCPGATEFAEKLVTLGFTKENIHRTRPATNTRFETDALAEVAKQNRLRHVLMVSLPYHWPRSLSCVIGSMAMVGYDFNVHYLPLPCFNPHLPMLSSQSNEPVTMQTEMWKEALKLACEYWPKGREKNGSGWRESYGAPPEVIFDWLDKH